MMVKQKTSTTGFSKIHGLIGACPNVFLLECFGSRIDPSSISIGGQKVQHMRDGFLIGSEDDAPLGYYLWGRDNQRTDRTKVIIGTTSAQINYVDGVVTHYTLPHIEKGPVRSSKQSGIHREAYLPT